MVHHDLKHQTLLVFNNTDIMDKLVCDVINYLINEFISRVTNQLLNDSLIQKFIDQLIDQLTQLSVNCCSRGHSLIRNPPVANLQSIHGKASSIGRLLKWPHFFHEAEWPPRKSGGMAGR